MTPVAIEEKKVDPNLSSNYTRLYGPRDFRKQFSGLGYISDFILAPLLHTSITEFLSDLGQNPSENGILSLIGYDLAQQIRNGRPWPLNKKDTIRRSYFLTEERDLWGIKSVERIDISLVERNISIADVSLGIPSDEEYLLIEKLLLKGGPRLVNKTWGKMIVFTGQQSLSELINKSKEELENLVDKGLILDKCMSDFYQVKF